MNNLPKVFEYQGRQVRTIIKDGEPWFVAKDACDVLEISKYRDAVAKLDDDERMSMIVDTPGGPQEMTVVNEPGLYALILVASRKPEAREFKRWITHEVLPSIRQTGSYSLQPQPTTVTEALLQAVQILATQEKQIKALEEKVNIAHHRINCLDNLDTIGDPQQLLNAMVRKYAQREGISFSQAWHAFRQAYNTAYRTNITMLVENASLKHGKRLTLPQYLAMVGRLDDAIRVADKMLNRAS